MLSGGFDMTFLVLDFPNNDGADLTDWNMTFDVFASAAKARKANAAVLATVPECLSADTARELAVAASPPWPASTTPDRDRGSGDDRRKAQAKAPCPSETGTDAGHGD